jgi:hypothetical protein
MSQADLMKDGLQDLFSPQQKFQREADYGRKILYVAWAVEILAAMIGLTIAIAVGWDAFKDIENPNTSQVLNAVLGALPFLVIAVIEPTKIPLAGGFYKTRILSWKILILLALVGLTAVTFETMFNGLERNLTHVTKKIVNSENVILSLTDERNEISRQLEELQNKSADQETEDLERKRLRLQEDLKNEIVQIRSESEQRLNQLQQEKQSLEDQIVRLAPEGNSQELDDDVKSLRASRAEKISRRNDLLERSDEERERRQEELENNRIDKNRLQEQRREALEKNIVSSETSKNALENQLQELSTRHENKLISENNRNQKRRSELNDDAKNCPKGIFGGCTKDSQERIKNDRENEQQRHEKALERFVVAEKEERETLNGNLSNAEKDIARFRERLRNLMQPESQGLIPQIESTRLRQIEAKIDDLNKEIDDLDNDINGILSQRDGRDKLKVDQFRKQIGLINGRVDQELTLRSQKIRETRERYAPDLERLNTMTIGTQLSVTEQKDRIPQLEENIANISARIDAAKSQKRDASYDNQVYRLAALVYGKSDVAEVTREEIKVVSIVWFGSIALIISSIGTILALISCILRDPEAFVERDRYKLFRAIGNLLKYSILGYPLQKALRKGLVALRKHLNKPKIRSVEKTIHVEVPVEKIVVKEVAVEVEKVVVREVPVEVIRKELIYVPLYSTEAGMIDSTSSLKGFFPNIKQKDTEDADSINIAQASVVNEDPDTMEPGAPSKDIQPTGTTSADRAKQNEPQSSGPVASDEESSIPSDRNRGN